MRINKINLDLAKFVFTIVAVILAANGLVSWWVVLLFVLYGIEVKWSFSV